MPVRTLGSLFNAEDEKVVKCPECGRTVRLDEDVVCPECGIELSDSEDISEIEASMSDSEEEEDMACYYDEDGVPITDEDDEFGLCSFSAFDKDEDEDEGLFFGSECDDEDEEGDEDDEYELPLD